MKTSCAPTRSMIQRFVSALPALSLAVAGFFPGEARAQITTWGNVYQLGNAGTATVNPTNSGWVTFTATEAMEVSAAQIYNSSALTGSPELTVSIRAVDSNGVPTGPSLGSNVFTPTGIGWQRVTLPDVALTSGVVYAMEVTTSTPSASFPWRFNAGPTGGIQPYGTPDEDFFRGGGTSLPATSQNVWILETDIGRAIGQPYTSSTAQNAASSTNSLGQRFRFEQTGSNDAVSAITLQLGIGATGASPAPAPTNPVVVKLIDNAGQVLAEGSLDLSDEAPGTVGNYVFDLDQTQPLVAGDLYYIALYTNGSTTNSVKWYGWNTLLTPDPMLIGASFQGADSYSLLWGSQTDFTGTQTALTTRDYYFALNLVPEPTTAGLIALAGGALLLSVRRRTIRA